jgi:hypothetical protein
MGYPSMTFAKWLGLVGLVSSCGGCGGSEMPAPAAPLSPPTELCTPTTKQNCRGPAQIESWLQRPDLRIVGAAKLPEGIQGAQVMTLAVPTADGERVFRAKWRAHSTSGYYGRPRYELAAHAAQKLFLPPEQYVAPPAAGHCFELSEYRAKVEPNAQANFQGTNCVYGIFSYWLENVRTVEDATDDDLFDARGMPDDPELFWKNESYRRSVADTNLLTMLIRHNDGHPAQFLLNKDPVHPRIFIVDSSMAFESPENPKLTENTDWSKLQVPALSRASLERLKAADERVIEGLAVVEQYALTEDGQLSPTERQPPMCCTDAPLRWHGRSLQVGLTASEIAGVKQRRQAILARAERGEIKTF